MREDSVVHHSDPSMVKTQWTSQGFHMNHCFSTTQPTIQKGQGHQDINE